MTPSTFHQLRADAHRLLTCATTLPCDRESVCCRLALAFLDLTNPIERDEADPEPAWETPPPPASLRAPARRNG